MPQPAGNLGIVYYYLGNRFARILTLLFIFTVIDKYESLVIKQSVVQTSAE